MNATLEHALNAALIFGARLYGDPTYIDDNTRSYHWRFDCPLTCTSHQVFIRDTQLLKREEIRLYARHRKNWNGEITETGRFGGGELFYYIERQPEETP